uniref:Peptidase metallopeptidase domain-containing protein n=1 Tax=Callorhinchus milii TaxID=7868 RepID=A0A4W3HQZ3_CALMI
MRLLKPPALLVLLSAVLCLTFPPVSARREINENDWSRCRRNGFLLSQKIMEMQQFFHLRLTGTLDEDTMEEIEKPRCGYPDVKSFTLFGGSPRWPRNTVTYRYSCFANIDVSESDQAIAEAFKVWSDVTPLKFLKRNSGNADIVIFSAADHGDGGNSRFDGRNGVLAHAYAPGRGIGGDTHFDAAERWSLTSNGINFFLVAAHEFGHALGLGHSNDRRALIPGGGQREGGGRRPGGRQGGRARVGRGLLGVGEGSGGLG